MNYEHKPRFEIWDQVSQQNFPSKQAFIKRRQEGLMDTAQSLMFHPRRQEAETRLMADNPIDYPPPSKPKNIGNYVKGIGALQNRQETMTQAVVAAGEYAIRISKLTPEETVPQGLTEEFQDRIQPAFESAKPFTEKQREAYYRTKQVAEAKRTEIRERENLLLFIESPEFGKVLDETIQEAKVKERESIRLEQMPVTSGQIVEAVVITEPPVKPRLESEATREKVEPKPVLVIDCVVGEASINGKVLGLTGAQYNGLFELADYVDEPVSSKTIKEVMFNFPYPPLKRIYEIMEGLQDKLEAATQTQGLIQVEKKLRSALFTLTNCEVVFKEEEQLPDPQKTEPVEKPEPKFTVAIEEGQFVVAGKKIIFNKTETQILQALLNLNDRRTTATLNREIFPTAPMEATMFRETLHSLKATLRRVTGVDVLSITRGSNGGVELKGLQFVNPSEDMLPSPTPKAVETTPQPDNRENQQNALNEKDFPILSTLIRKYNGSKFTLRNGQQITLEMSDEALHICDGLSKVADVDLITGLAKQPGEYLRLRKNLIRKLSRLFSGPGFESSLQDYPESARLLLEELFLISGMQNILSHLGSVLGNLAVVNEREYLTKPSLGVPEVRHDAQIYQNGKSEKKDIDQLLERLRSLEAVRDLEQVYPIGQLLIDGGTVKGYTTWADEDIVKFLLRKLPKADQNNHRVVEALWVMTSSIRNNPDNVRFRLPGRGNLRSVDPRDVPGTNLTRGESGNTRLIFKVLKYRDQKIVALDSVFRDHDLYNNYVTGPRVT